MTEFKNTLMYKEINETVDALGRVKTINGKTITELIAKISERGIADITISARGTSNHAGIFFKYLAEIITPYRVAFFNPGVFTVYEGKSRLDNLVIGISQSGKAVDVLEVLKRAKKDGAITVAMTNDLDSPMAKEAEFHLFLGCGEEKSVAATKTFSTQIYLLSYLARSLSKMAIQDDIPELLTKNLSIIDKLSDDLSEKLKTEKDGFVLSRGITSSLAFEAALKLQETCYIKMKGYAYSDFQHGPMAMVSDGVPVIIFAPKIGIISEEGEKSHTLEVKAIIKKMRDLGGEVFIITDSDEYAEYGNNYMVKGGSCEIETMFVLTYLTQMTACKLSCKIGNNPDSPRALKKVTVTK